MSLTNKHLIENLELLQQSLRSLGIKRIEIWCTRYKIEWNTKDNCKYGDPFGKEHEVHKSKWIFYVIFVKLWKIIVYEIAHAILKNKNQNGVKYVKNQSIQQKNVNC